MELPNHGWDEHSFAETAEQRGIDLQTYLQRLHHINTCGLPVRLRVESVRRSDNSFLQLVCVPGRGFTHLSNDARAVASFLRGERYHISLCFGSEVRDWSAYDRIRRRYDGKTGVLSVAITNSAADLVPGSALSNELLNDPDIEELHSHGKYAERNLHLSL